MTLIKNKNLFQATTTALNGVLVLAREKAFWREFALLIAALAALIAKPSAISVLLLLVSVLMISVEALNTAIERLCDVVQPEQDTRIRDIKDVAAAAIFVLTLTYGGLLITLFARW